MKIGALVIVGTLLSGLGLLPQQEAAAQDAVQVMGESSSPELAAPVPLAATARVASFRKAQLYNDPSWVSTTVVGWLTLAETSVKLGGTRRQCVEIQFSANLYTDDTQAFFRALVDDADVGSQLVWETGQNRDSHGVFHWWNCGLVSNGEVHNVKVQISPLNPRTVGAGAKTLVVRYNK